MFESRITRGKALLVRMAIISLHVNVKTPFHLLLFKILASFEGWHGGGAREICGVGIAPCPPLATAPCIAGSEYRNVNISPTQ